MSEAARDCTYPKVLSSRLLFKCGSDLRQNQQTRPTTAQQSHDLTMTVSAARAFSWQDMPISTRAAGMPGPGATIAHGANLLRLFKKGIAPTDWKCQQMSTKHLEKPLTSDVICLHMHWHAVATHVHSCKPHIVHLVVVAGSLCLHQSKKSLTSIETCCKQDTRQGQHPSPLSMHQGTAQAECTGRFTQPSTLPKCGTCPCEKGAEAGLITTRQFRHQAARGVC